MAEVQLGSRVISEHSRPYVIAEIGVNHEGSVDLAKRLIDGAQAAGADAAKFQTYKAESLASRDSPPYWDLNSEPTASQFQLFKKYDGFGAREFEALARHCESVGIQFVSTPFDDYSADFLDPLMPFYKVASADITNIPLLRHVASKNKPVLLSTGAATLPEIDLAVACLRESGSAEVVLLHCVLNYPTRDLDAHLRMILGLRHAYPDLIIGYSDHTIPDEEMTALCTAFLLGARVIEKHFTHDRSLPGNDHYHAMDESGLKRFLERVGRIEDLLGPTSLKTALPSEAPARRNARRSLVLRRDLEEDHVLTPADIIPKRPATGISPVFWDDVVGRRIRQALAEDHVLSWRDLAEE